MSSLSRAWALGERFSVAINKLYITQSKRDVIQATLSANLSKMTRIKKSNLIFQKNKKHIVHNPLKD